MEVFWDKVKKSSGCWEWVGSKNRGGYGYLNCEGKTHRAHRVSWFIATGKWPLSSEYVLHHCDNRACVRPDHLYLGDQFANMADMVTRRRFRSGLDHPKGKLSDDHVRNIRATIGPCRAVARAYGISPSQVSRIRSGKRRPVAQACK